MMTVSQVESGLYPHNTLLVILETIFRVNWLVQNTQNKT